MAFAESNTIIYENERGSILSLNFDDEDILTGTYKTTVASKECQDVVGIERPIIGYIVGSAITFSVKYPSCGSVVSLTGHITPNKYKIDTIAVIAHQTSMFGEYPGSQFLTHATFKKQW